MIRILCMALLLTTACSTTSEKRISMVHTQIGTTYLKDKKFPQAFRELFTAVDMDPENAIAHNHLGLTYILANRLNQAEIHLKKALELRENYTDATVNYAYLLLEQKKYAQAIKKLEKAEEDLTYQEQHKILALKGRAQFYLNQYEKAVNNLRKAILKERKYCPAHRFFGPSLVSIEKLDRAIKAIEHAIAICEKEKYEELYYYGALAYFQVEDYFRAEAKLKELNANFPSTSYKSEAAELKEIIERKK